MADWVLNLLLFLAAIPVALACAYFNRVRGANAAEYPFWGKHQKFLSILAISLVSAIPVALKFWFEWGAEYYLLGIGLLVVLILGDLLLLKPSWGEIFVHTLDTYMKDFAYLVKPLTNAMVGYKYDSVTAANDALELNWKEKAWVTRFSVYGLLSITVYCVAARSPIPAIIWLVGSLWVGFFYARAEYLKQYKPTERSEKLTGAWIGALRTLSLMS